jgi:hypothetical protein
LTMEFHINWIFFIIIIPCQFQHNLFFFLNVELFKYFFICKDQNFVKEDFETSTNHFFAVKKSKIINYSTNICWSCQDTIVAHYVFTTTSISEGRLFVCFVLYLWDPWKGDAALNRVPGAFGKLWRRSGAWAWYAKVIEYWMIFSLKIELNHSWNFWGTGKCWKFK